MRIGIHKRPWLLYRASTFLQRQVPSSAAGLYCEAGVSGKEQSKSGLPASDESGPFWRRMVRGRVEHLDTGSVGVVTSHLGNHGELLWPPLVSGSDIFFSSPGPHFAQGMPPWSVADTSKSSFVSEKRCAQDADQVPALFQGGLAGRLVAGQEFSLGATYLLDPASRHGLAFPLATAAARAATHFNESLFPSLSGGCSIHLPDLEGALMPMEASSVKRKRKKKMNKHKQRKLRRRDRHRK